MRKILLSITILLLFSVWSVWPVLKSPLDTLPQGNEDILIVWILNQTIQKIPGNINNIFQGNIFYPYINTIAYSDLLVPSAITASIPVKLSGSPLVGYNFSLFTGQF